MYVWSSKYEGSDGEFQRRSAMSSFRILRTSDPEQLWQRIVEEIDRWLEPSAVRAYRLDADGAPVPVLSRSSESIPTDAALMEAALLIRALSGGRSRISNHPQVGAELEDLSEGLGRAGNVVLVLLVRAHQKTHGVLTIHWIGKERPSHVRRSGFYTFWDNVGLAVAGCEERLSQERERARLERAAFFDHMTGLPNQAGLDRELGRHEGTHPLGILVADFDGMREANAAFENNYALGGDVLIHAVADELRRFAGEDEFAARLHTRGDEFCLLLPGSDEATTARRAQELEAALEGLQVPASHRHVYKGASVGHASRTPEERPGRTLGRASVQMHARKTQRRGDR